jgi:hypothetical protein
MSDITYEMYLEAVKLGLNPKPELNVTGDVCKGVNCNKCFLKPDYDCTGYYLKASKIHYPTLLTQNPELAL